MNVKACLTEDHRFPLCDIINEPFRLVALHEIKKKKEEKNLRNQLNEFNVLCVSACQTIH